MLAKLFKKYHSLLLLLIFTQVGIFGMAQSTAGFSIDKQGTYTTQQLSRAMETGKMDCYRKMNSDVRLYFDDGTEILLKSAQYLITHGQPVVTTSLIPEYVQDNPQRVFSIMSNGRLAVLCPVKQVK
ncbi:MAG: hypothetical protein H6581_03105 [Bacteroidia bacterium]|nr:hypothetical protein [Bacteroidia bacterium]